MFIIYLHENNIDASMCNNINITRVRYVNYISYKNYEKNKLYSTPSI